MLHKTEIKHFWDHFRLDLLEEYNLLIILILSMSIWNNMID